MASTETETVQGVPSGIVGPVEVTPHPTRGRQRIGWPVVARSIPLDLVTDPVTGLIVGVVGCGEGSDAGF